MADEFASLRNASLISEAALRVDVAADVVAATSREAADDEAELQRAWAACEEAEEAVTALQEQLHAVERVCAERANGLQSNSNNTTHTAAAAAGDDDNGGSRESATVASVAALRFRLEAARRDVAQKGDALQQLQRAVEERQQRRVQEARRQALQEQQQQEEEQQRQRQQQQQQQVSAAPVPLRRGKLVQPLSVRVHDAAAATTTTTAAAAAAATAAAAQPSSMMTMTAVPRRQRPLPGTTLDTYSGGTVLPSLNRVLVSRAEIRARHLRYEDDNDPAAFAARVRKRRKLERVNALLLQEQQQQQQQSLSSSSTHGEQRAQHDDSNNNNTSASVSTSSSSLFSAATPTAATAAAAAVGVKTEVVVDEDDADVVAAVRTQTRQPPTAIDVDLLMEEEEAIGDGIVRQLLQSRHAERKHTQQPQQQPPPSPSASVSTEQRTSRHKKDEDEDAQHGSGGTHKREVDVHHTTAPVAVKAEVKQEEEAATSLQQRNVTPSDDSDSDTSSSSSSSSSSSTRPSRRRQAKTTTAAATLADVTVVPGIRMAAAVYARLFDYQQEGLRWLLRLHLHRCGGILGDEMGLGKTIQVAALVNALAHSHCLAGPVLIVAPMTVLRQWVAELHRWAPYVRTCVMHVSSSSSASLSREALLQSVQGTAAVVVTTYAALRAHGALLHTAGFQYIILDEGHKIANPDAGITLVAKSFATPHRLILSGSPIQNSLKELWCLVDFVRPGLLGSLAGFIDAFEVPIGQSKNPRATPLALATAVECARALQRRIAPYLLRRLKSVVNATLPRRYERVVRVLLTDEQLRLYVDVVASPAVQRLFSQALYFPKLGMRLDSDGRDATGSLHVAGASLRHAESRRVGAGRAGGGRGGGGGAAARGLHLEAFRVMNQLRQICNHADLYTVLRGLHEEEEEVLQQQQQGRQHAGISRVASLAMASCGGVGGAQRRRLLLAAAGGVGAAARSFRSNLPVNLAGSAKLQALQQMLCEWHKHDHRVLVFSQTRMMLDILENLCEQDNYRYIRLDGTTSNRHRQELIDRYNEDTSVFVALLTTRVGGIGVNLVGADRVVIYDPDWNPVTDVQARERAWRIGQTREVCVYRLITSGTVEEAILRRQLAKTYVTEKVLRDPTMQRFFHVHDSFVEHFFLGLDYDTRIPSGKKHVLSPYDMRGPRRTAQTSSNNNSTTHHSTNNNDNKSSRGSNNNEQDGDNDESLLLGATGPAAHTAINKDDDDNVERAFGEVVSVTHGDNDNNNDHDNNNNNNNSSSSRGSRSRHNSSSAADVSDDAETRLLRELVDGQEVIVSGSDAVAQRLARVGAEQAMQRVATHATTRTLAQQYSEYSLLRAAEEQRKRAEADRDEQRRYASEEGERAAAAAQQRHRRGYASSTHALP